MSAGKLQDVPIVLLCKFIATVLIVNDVVKSSNPQPKANLLYFILLLVFFNFSGQNSLIIISDMDFHEAFYLGYW